MWFNIRGYRGETELAAKRLAIMLRRDLKRAGELIED